MEVKLLKRSIVRPQSTAHPLLPHFAANLPPEVLARLASNKEASDSSSPSGRHLVANFGKAVPLGETQHMYLVVTNRCGND